MKISLPEQIHQGIKRARRYVSSRALVLLYHRVAEAESDPWQLAVSPTNFEEHLQILSRYWQTVSLREMTASLDKRKLPRRSIVVTFDDGYANNLLAAKPLLEKYEVPATVFVATGYTGTDREFWWDELERLFLEVGVLPEVLSLQMNGKRKQWQLGDEAFYDEAARCRNTKWRGWHADEPTSRHAVYRAIWNAMRPMSENDRLSCRLDLLTWAGADKYARDTHRALKSEELVELTSDGLIKVGAHTVTHAQLSALDLEAQRSEIRQSKLRLEEIVGNRIAGFAYPYGGKGDYSSETISLVRDTGFSHACTTSADFVRRGTDPFQLPRVQVTDVDGESFSRLISEWMARETA